MNMKKIVGIVIAVSMSMVIALILLMGIFFPRKYIDCIKDNARKYHLDESMVASVINIESGYDECATSNRGAVGLMQIMPSTAMEIAGKIGMDIDDVAMLYSVEINIELGCYYLRYLLDYFRGNVINALCAYNWGMSNVREWLDGGNADANGNITNIPVTETRKYISKYQMHHYVYSHIYNYTK